jgi:aryl-alcohol dehydrogenase-like predicted oxidoreductase
LFGDAALLAVLGELRDSGVLVGLTTSGPRQADALRRALEVHVGGRPLFAAAQVTWNLLETSVAPAAAAAAEAGWTILVKEALANGRLAPGGDDSPAAARLAAVAAARGAGTDAIALAAALANPWATIVLSGAVTTGQLHANLAALTVGELPPDLADLAESPEAYWATRAARPWR